MIDVTAADPLFPRCLFCGQGDELPIGRLVPLVEEGDAQKLVGDVDAAAVPGNLDGISLESSETALKRAFSGVLRGRRVRGKG